MNNEQIFQECLDEMFRRVGIRYSKKFVGQIDWYRNKSWTENEEKSFKDWMVGLLRKKKRWTKRMSEKEAGWFVFNYGWKYVPRGALKVKTRN